MTDRPILFSGEMVRAILAGRKTQTRRAWRWQPLDVMPHGKGYPNQWLTLNTRAPNHGSIVRCRYGVPGDRLWVRETWRQTDGYQTLYYRADEEYAEAGEWKPSIHMPKWASRITLEVMSVRAERVQSISRGDVVAEGVETKAYSLKLRREAYAALWDKINGQRAPWASNPWVWVVEFQRVTA